MKKFLLSSALMGATLLTSPYAFAAQDIISLKNGDMISGQITAKDDTNIVIDTAYGVLTIPSENIEGLSMTDTVSNNVAAEEISAIEPAAGDAPSTGLWGAQWSGQVSAGAELETGNSDSQNYGVDGKVEANWDDKHRAKIAIDYEFEEENDSTVTDERELDFAYDYFFNDKWFWNNQLDFEQDKVENLDLRTEFTSGLGYRFYTRDDLKLEVTFGPGYKHEDYETSGTDDSMTANWSLDYKQSFYDDFMRLYHNHTWNTPTDDFSAYLFESDSGVEIPLSFGIIAKGEIEFDWNNDPSPENTEEDTTYRLLLGYEW